MNEHVGKPFDLNHLVTLLLRHVPHVAVPQKGATLVAGASTATTPAADAPGWIPSVLDVDTAMARMGGAQTLYVRAARAFAAELPDQLRQVRQQMTLDRVHVGQLLHTLKGSAATLGANALAEAAARLEQRCNPALGAAADWDEALAALQGAASATQAAVAHTVERLDATPKAAVPLPPPVCDAQVALRELVTLLEASDLHALRKFAEIRPALLAVDPSLLNELDQAIQALQFGTAQRLCQAIARASASQP
jgi:HPt (histidine-containing phosphotransfer) domain-containing protein